MISNSPFLFLYSIREYKLKVYDSSIVIIKGEGKKNVMYIIRAWISGQKSISKNWSLFCKTEMAYFFKIVLESIVKSSTAINGSIGK